FYLSHFQFPEPFISPPNTSFNYKQIPSGNTSVIIVFSKSQYLLFRMFVIDNIISYRIFYKHIYVNTEKNIRTEAFFEAPILIYLFPLRYSSSPSSGCASGRSIMTPPPPIEIGWAPLHFSIICCMSTSSLRDS